MIVYRIIHKAFSEKLSATGMQGRWNSDGNKVIYCAESIALAFLENMIRRQGLGFNNDFKIMSIEIPYNLKIISIREKDMEAGWKNFTDYSKCQLRGNKWYQQNKSAVLKVPSALLADSYNYVINTLHPEYKKIKLAAVSDLTPDVRIEKILKGK